MMSKTQTITDFLAENGVELLPCHLLECTRFGLSLPQVVGWEPPPEQMFPDATAVMANRDRVLNDFAPNMVVLVGKLTRAVDSESLLDHAFYDSRLLPEWIETESDRMAFSGYPTATISGSFQTGPWLLAAATRYSVVQPIVDQYLVQVTVTTLMSQRNELAADLGELMNGVRFGL